MYDHCEWILLGASYIMSCVPTRQNTDHVRMYPDAGHVEVRLLLSIERSSALSQIYCYCLYRWCCRCCRLPRYNSQILLTYRSVHFVAAKLLPRSKNCSVQFSIYDAQVAAKAHLGPRKSSFRPCPLPACLESASHVADLASHLCKDLSD
jgi:hypothetical protein